MITKETKQWDEYKQILSIKEAMDKAEEDAFELCKVAWSFKTRKWENKGFSPNRIDFYRKRAEQRAKSKARRPYYFDLFKCIQKIIDRSMQEENAKILWDNFVDFRDVTIGDNR